MNAAPPAAPTGATLVVDPFCYRQFKDPNYAGTKINVDKAEFEKIVNEFFEKSGQTLADGYAPFCKHVFMPNFTDATSPVVEITADIEPLIRTAYEARTKDELAVLTRYVPASSLDKQPAAKMLDLILYSREQIIKENEATGQQTPHTQPWGIVSIKAQDADHELPMAPITMMRNALGKEEGGSGVPLSKEKYNESVAFWETHVNLK